MRSVAGEAQVSGLTCDVVVMRNMQLMSSEQPVASLYWLAFLLTGQCERSIDIAVEAVTSAGTSSPLFESGRGCTRRGRRISMPDEIEPTRLASTAGRELGAR